LCLFNFDTTKIHQGPQKSPEDSPRIVRFGSAGKRNQRYAGIDRSLMAARTTTQDFKHTDPEA
jgi:hypothetical protein